MDNFPYYWCNNGHQKDRKWTNLISFASITD